jgi:hypothetical protein
LFLLALVLSQTPFSLRISTQSAAHSLGSTSRRNMSLPPLLPRNQVLVEGLCRCPPPERLARAGVQRERDGIEIFAGMSVKIGTLREVLTQERV